MENGLGKAFEMVTKLTSVSRWVEKTDLEQLNGLLRETQLAKQEAEAQLDAARLIVKRVKGWIDSFA